MKKGEVLFILFLVAIVTGLSLPSFVYAQGTCNQNCDWVGPPCKDGFLTNSCDPGFAPVPDPGEICGEILLKPACINGISCTCVFTCLASEAGLCTDGLDNDCDGNTDCSDSECTCDDTCDTTPPSTPSSSVPSLTTDTTPTVSYSGATDNCGVAFVSHIRRTGAGCGGGIVRTSISSSNPSGSFTFSNLGLGWFSSQFKVTDNAGNSGSLSSCANTRIVECIVDGDCSPGETCIANTCQTSDPDADPGACATAGGTWHTESQPFGPGTSSFCCGDDSGENQIDVTCSGAVGSACCTDSSDTAGGGYGGGGYLQFAPTVCWPVANCCAPTSGACSVDSDCCNYNGGASGEVCSFGQCTRTGCDCSPWCSGYGPGCSESPSSFCCQITEGNPGIICGQEESVLLI